MKVGDLKISPGKLIKILNIWAKFLYSPLLEDKVRKMQETNSTIYGAQAASKVHKELKRLEESNHLENLFLWIEQQLVWVQYFSI